MTMTFVLAMMGILVFLGIPIAIALLVPSFLYLAVNGIPLTSAIGRMSGTLNSFTLLAIPFFIIAGNLMNHGGLTARLIDFTKALVGHFKGGLAQVNVVANMIFAGMSGSAVADAGGLGSVLIKPMKEDGYKGSFAAALTAAAATLGPLIPPSIPMVIYAVIAEESIGRLFLGGAVPGVLLGFMLMIMVRILPQAQRAKVYPKATWAEFGRTLPTGSLALLMPVIIIAGLAAGLFTATEAAAVAGVYAAIVCTFILRGMSGRTFYNAMIESILTTGNVLLIVAAASIFGWILAREGATSAIGTWISSLGLSKLQLLFLINALLLFLGCILEGISILIVLTPVLLPIIQAAGIDPVYFGVMMVYNINIGLITPPMGLLLYVVCDLSKEKFEHVVRDVIVFYIPMLIILLAMTCFPPIILALPDYVFR